MTRYVGIRIKKDRGARPACLVQPLRSGVPRGTLHLPVHGGHCRAGRKSGACPVWPGLLLTEHLPEPDWLAAQECRNMELLLKRAGFRADRLSIWAMQVQIS